MRSTNKRAYQMRARANKVDDTRQQIVEAAVRLHGTIGPAATTVSALAEEAGVTRLTVYRHFPDDADLFAACSQHWGSQQTYPDPSQWEAASDPVERLRVGLTDLYRFYADGEAMLTRIQRDRDVLPAAILEWQDSVDAHYCEVLLQRFRARGSRKTRLRALIGHATAFWTWRSLVVDQGLCSQDAVTAMVAMVRSEAGPVSVHDV